MTDCLDAALRYAARGWRVIALDGKLPFGGSKAYLDATIETKTIRRWWREHPDANVGIACSSTHGPIVLDLDEPANAKELNAFDYLDEFTLPETRAARSRANRLHLYFDPPFDGTTIKRMIRPFRVNGQKVAIDILGDGGYVVAPPSIHPETGRRYRWMNRFPRVPFPTELLEQIGDAIDLKKSKHAEPLPDIIGEGERDNLLTSLAGSMRRRGADEETILAALRDLNARRVSPPLPDKDLRRIASSIAKKPTAGLGENLTDLGNARRFIAQHAENVRNCAAMRKEWLIWEGTHWQPDATGEVERMAKNTVRSLYDEAAQTGDEDARDAILKHAVRSEQASAVRGLLTLASSEPEISIAQDMLDHDKWLFNVENGTLDLKTGKLLKHRREDLVTKLAPVEFNPKATAPRWELFLREIMAGDEELVKFIQLAFGYAMTGDTREECLFFCYGGGSNGKTKLFEVLRALFGDYGQVADFSTFMSKSGDGPRNDIARMHGARLITSSESDGDKPFDARIIKMLTGGDTVSARRLYEEAFEFSPQHKLFLGSNHKPIVKEQTTGFWRRIRLIPFTENFEGKRMDKRLPEKLRAELSGILNWSLQGCLEWQRTGLIEPKAVRRATRDYRDDNDLLGEFITARCQLDASAWTSTIELYRVFSDWWTETRGLRASPISQGWFTRMLSERRELRSVKTKDLMRGWRGITIAQEIGDASY